MGGLANRLRSHGFPSPGTSARSLAVALTLQPLRKSASCAAVYEEVHTSPTDTWARESPAMTLWA